jgi:type II secretory pathway pseudopilin PulG
MLSDSRTKAGPIRSRCHRASEAGFTLVEALCAIVILLFGIMAIANLMIVAASSNSVANQSTAATAIASQQMEALKAVRFTDLVAGGELDTTLPPQPGFFVDQDVPGVGQVHLRWRIDALGPTTFFITVQAEGTGALSRARSRATFTTFRSCMDVTIGCPAQTPAP